MKWNITRISGEPLAISLKAGDRLFIVGANGSGKSALIQHLFSSNPNEKIKRISAHRQTWLESGGITITQNDRIEFERYYRRYEANDEARWKDYNAQEKQSAVLFDLRAKDNARARRIAQFVDEQKTKKATKTAAESVSLFDQINELLAIGNLKVTLENSDDEEILARHRDTDTEFSIAQMSDGERNAAILAANVLTVDPGTVLLIDEPERHLHRSIIEPFLSALFQKREDCVFVVSTHEVALPVANPSARVIMVRSCQWKDDKATAWDVQELPPDDEIPEELKLAILGSRKRILFVEGRPHSLDTRLYGALFPNLSVVPRESSANVQRSVKGMRGSYDLHHVEAFGLIDRDGRTDEEVKQLACDNIFALDAYSVESLYYCSDAIAAVAHRQAESLGRDVEKMIESATNSVFESLYHEGLAEDMAARRCELRVRRQIRSRAPSWKKIRDNESAKITVEVCSPYSEEVERFKKLRDDRKLDDLVNRYPLRESQVFDAIAKSLDIKNKRNYEETLLSRIQNDEELSDRLKRRLESLVCTLEDTNQ